MSQPFLDTRAGGLRLYLNGELQFDRRDERRYHEPLAAVPVALAARRAPGRALRVLILGGGDGLALREVLRFPEVAEAVVVDRDPEVLALGRDALAALNHEAFADPRVRVHAADARDYLRRARRFDVLIYDLTYPGDVLGAALFSVARFRAARAALVPGGVLAVNAVSPQETPEGFGCVGATLGAVGLSVLPYAFVLPSFLEEGYGRWGFLYASSRAIGRAELRALSCPPGVSLTPEAVLAGTLFPTGAAARMRVAPNRTDELLYYLCNATPLAWDGPLRPLRFAPSAPWVGPRVTAAHGFARWLREPAGRRSVERLLHCLPLARRGQSRAALLEWSEQAEVLFHEVDLRAFVDEALRRAGQLPRAWAREIMALRDRLRDGLPPMRELLEQAYRVFAVFMLVLLLANLVFPDNLYAKGFTSSGGIRSGGSSVTTAGPSHGFDFSDPTARFSPYRYRPGVYGVRSAGTGAGVHDPQGGVHPSQRFAFTAAAGDPKPIAALLALTAELQLLESGALGYVAGIPGYQCVLEPGRVRVLDAAGREVTAFLPGRALEDEVRRQLEAQGPLIERAVAEHRRWLEWVRWGARTPPGREAVSEMEALDTIKRTVARAHDEWRSALPSPLVLARPGWVPVFPGIYLEGGPRVPPVVPGAVPTVVPTVVIVTPAGQLRSRLLLAPTVVTDEERFLFQVLSRHAAQVNDVVLKEALAHWTEALRAPRGFSPSGSRS